MSITFNGTNSDSLGVIVEKIPNPQIAARRVTTEIVPGRNGVLLQDDKSFATVNASYAMHISAEGGKLFHKARKVAAWLLATPGFLRLEDSYEDDVFRLARYNGGIDITSYFLDHGTFNCQFECQPQRFLKSGEAETRVESNVSGTSTMDVANLASNVKRVKLNVSQDASIEPCVGSLKIYKSDNPSDYISATMTEIVAPDDFVYTNVMDNSGAQFKAGLRYSKGSAAFVSNNDPACDAVVIPIPSNVSNIRIRVKNATFSAYNTIYGGTNGRTFPTDYGRYQVNPSPLQDENGDVYFDFTNTGSSYITFNLVPVSNPSALIVTVNEPIVKINADGVAEYKGSLLMTAGYDSAVAAINEQGNPNARLITIDADGNEINAVAMRSGQAVIINPTQFEARPLLKFIDTSTEPQIVPQTLTDNEDTYIDVSGEVENWKPAWQGQESTGYVTCEPVSVTGYAYAFVTGNSYAFYDENDHVLSFVPDYYKARRVQMNNVQVIIPSGASVVVIGTKPGAPNMALSLKAARANPGTNAVTINGTTISLDFSAHDTIYLDCDLHDAYYLDGSSANDKVTFSSTIDKYPTFPGLFPGENTVIVRDGENLNFSIIPRWWVL